MSRAGPKKRIGYHHGNLREVLVETGLKVIEKHGVNGLTLREIGLQAGVSRTAAYRHFSGKGELLCAISEAGFALFRRDLETALHAAAPGFFNRFAAMAIAYVRFAMRHRARYGVMFDATLYRSADRAEWREDSARAFSLLEDTIRDGQREGEVRKGDPTLLATVVWSHIHGISTLRLAVGPDGELDEGLLAKQSQVLLEGLASATAQGPAPRKRRTP